MSTTPLSTRLRPAAGAAPCPYRTGRLEFYVFLSRNIEEGYKLFKCRLQLEAFSGKAALAIRQDFFAKLFMMTTTAVLAFPVEEQLKKESLQEQNLPSPKRKHPRQVNRTNALAMIKEVAAKVFMECRIRPALEALDRILKATTEKDPTGNSPEKN